MEVSGLAVGNAGLERKTGASVVSPLRQLVFIMFANSIAPLSCTVLPRLFQTVPTMRIPLSSLETLPKSSFHSRSRSRSLHFLITKLHQNSPTTLAALSHHGLHSRIWLWLLWRTTFNLEEKRNEEWRD
jgi:hypothetical protein